MKNLISVLNFAKSAYLIACGLFLLSLLLDSETGSGAKHLYKYNRKRRETIF